MEEILKSIKSEIESCLAPECQLIKEGAEELGDLANNLLKMGETQEAISCLKNAKKLCKENGILPKVAYFDIRLAECFLLGNETNKAIKHLEQARNEVLRMNNSKLLRDSFLMLAKCHKKRCAFKKAIKYYKDCIAIILDDWSKFKDIQLMSSFLNDKMEPFLEVIDLLCIDNKIDDAYKYVRLSKAKSIVEFNGNIPISSVTAVSQKNVKRIQEIRIEVEPLWQKINEMEEEINIQAETRPTTDIEARLYDENKHEISKKMTILKAHVRRIEREEGRLLRKNRESTFERIVSDNNEKEFRLSEIQGFLSQSDIVIDFFFTQNNLILFLLTKNKLLCEPVSISHEELIKQVKLTGFIMLKENETTDFDEEKLKDWESAMNSLSNLLHDIFIQPINKRLKIKENTTICFIPHGILHHMPLHIARWRDNTNISTCLNTSFYLPNIAFLSRYITPIKKQKRSLLAVANPDKDDSALSIHGVEEEVDLISKHFDKKKVLRHDEASLVNIINESSKYDVIHFACHGKVRGDIPEFSYLRLAHNQKLRVVDIISRMQLNAELIVLSSCNTAINKLDPSDEMQALARAFIYAGARTVIASLWIVEDDFSKTLMDRFYDLWLYEGQNKIDALQFAQKEMLKTAEWSSVFFWAPFILIGDPK